MKKILVAAMLLAATFAAWADNTYSYYFYGSHSYTPYCGVCGDPPLPPYPLPQNSSWVGTMSFTLADTTDGAHFYGDVSDITIVSNHFNSTGPGWRYSGVPMEFDTLNGQLISFSFGTDGSFGTNTRWSGNANRGVASLYGIGGHAGIEYGNASVFAVPEPSTYALMLAGIGLVGLALRRRKA